ncbi:hypothetical protein D9613_002574 [Agrocybe pediades]|uniref:Major facilitator superfamily (MFS) profile domain-containing protein n=1 Tax=Agrocybe pediades TaxID=84607 RepID=A0A8H4VPK6_9AGAR|nr:hypothetical protein D9613_002574 [Agrocybe pediades]
MPTPTARPRLSSRTTTSTSVPYVPQPESLIIPDGPVGEEAAELLTEFVHPHQRSSADTLVDSDEDENSKDEQNKKSQLPWWKRPSPWWLIGIMPFTSIAGSATIAPRIEIYTILACKVHKPEVFRQGWMGPIVGLPELFSLPSTPTKFYMTEDAQLSATSLERRDPQTIYLPAVSPLAIVSSDTEPVEPPPSRRDQCSKDPVVQAAVARLTAVITTSMGILSCITTAWWGAFSDRHGRTRVMGISILALLITDFNFILVTLFSNQVPGGYWFLVVGPILEGILGGLATGIAAMHGYLADTTTESSRSRVFSLTLGLLFTGMAIGPTLGSLLIRFTGQTLSVFYAAATAHVIYTIFVWTVLPESLSKKKMEQARQKYAAENQEVALERQQNPTFGLLVTLKRIFAFLSPLTIFMPIQGRTNGNPLKRPKTDYNLTLMVAAYGVTISLMGSYSSKFLYARSAFGWSVETLGYWLSIMGAARALFLAIILPVAIKLLKPKPTILVLPAPSRTESTPLLADDPQSPSGSSSQAPKTITKEIHSPLFDLRLAMVSLLVEIIGYTFMGLAPTGFLFTVFGAVSSFGTGFSPAVQSVTLALYARRGGTETGRLFGALSVIQALCSQIIGPSLYGFIYMKTVATYSRAIFFVSVISLIISFICLSFVRLPKESDYRRESLADLEETHQATTQALADDADGDATIRIPAAGPSTKKPAAFSYGST